VPSACHIGMSLELIGQRRRRSQIPAQGNALGHLASLNQRNSERVRKIPDAKIFT